MNRPDLVYPKLKYFFSAYFHQDWKSMYNLEGLKTSYETVVNDFKANNPRETVKQTITEIEFLISQNLLDDELKEIVVDELGANFRPAASGLTYQQWLKSVLDILKKK
jgi:hypothetical protein